MDSASLNHSMIDNQEAQAAQAAADQFGTLGHESIESMFISQRYDGYSEDNQEAWQKLYAEQMAYLPERASKVYLDGAKAIGLKANAIPNIVELNARLEPRTGWNSVPVPGYIPAKAFFACLAARRFPTTIVIRPLKRLDYLPEPDIFHDVFGHVPLHADPVFADFLQTYGQAALHATTEQQTEELARLFWFTVEFGLIQEDERLKVYGSGLISSPGESRHALESNEVERRPFDLEQVIATPFEIDHYQPILYTLDSFGQLREAMLTYASRLHPA